MKNMLLFVLVLFAIIHSSNHVSADAPYYVKKLPTTGCEVYVSSNDARPIRLLNNNYECILFIYTKTLPDVRYYERIEKNATNRVSTSVASIEITSGYKTYYSLFKKIKSYIYEIQTNNNPNLTEFQANRINTINKTIDQLLVRFQNVYDKIKNKSNRLSGNRKKKGKKEDSDEFFV